MIFPYPYSYLFSSDMVLYRENSKDSTKKPKKPQICFLSEFCKVAGYEINTQSQFLYNNKNYLERGFFPSKSFVSIWWAPGWLKTCLEVAGRGSGRSPYSGEMQRGPSKATELWRATHRAFRKDSLPISAQRLPALLRLVMWPPSS
ncbi:unnamed protein product [Rangifer tarandus platyrhynchus]|uniref:Uncharacterized protein n=1 Tax=Rangifer tarandus platyrhynchus TaxID=3082113 RepID=A0AC59Y541_RANTA